jgi:hypothetical protein
MGDFNEASHLDWTDKYAKSRRDRWVNNTSVIFLRQKITWAESKKLIDAGMKDAYLEVFPDPAAKPGNTWTPPYASGTPGRRPYDEAGKAGQVLDRIDWILFAGRGVKVLDAAIVGEDPSHPEQGNKSELFPEIRYSGHWPSDHRAALGVFLITSEAETEKHECSFKFNDVVFP